jgi:hypothetical protein
MGATFGPFIKSWINQSAQKLLDWTADACKVDQVSFVNVYS